jgi:hypothetical protein
MVSLQLPLALTMLIWDYVFVEGWPAMYRYGNPPCHAMPCHAMTDSLCVAY